MLSLSQGDSAGMLLAISDRSLVISASLVAAIVASNLIFGSVWQVMRINVWKLSAFLVEMYYMHSCAL